MRVLLIHPNDFPDPDRPPPLLPPNQAPPLGLAYIAAFLRRGGHDVAIEDMRHRGTTRKQLRRTLQRLDPEVVGISMYTATVPVAREISVIIKEISASTVVVVGGPHPAGAPEECARDPHFDYTAVGEGEQMMLELCDALEDGGDISTVAGLWYTEELNNPNAPLKVNEERGWIEDLDSLPWPARDLLPPLDSYKMTMFFFIDWASS